MEQDVNTKTSAPTFEELLAGSVALTAISARAKWLG